MKPRSVFVAVFLSVLTVHLIAVAFFGFSIALHQNHKQTPSALVGVKIVIATQDILSEVSGPAATVINDVISEGSTPICATVHVAGSSNVRFKADKGWMSAKSVLSNTGSRRHALILHGNASRTSWCAYYTAPRKTTDAKESDTITITVDGRTLAKTNFRVTKAPNPPA